MINIEAKHLKTIKRILAVHVPDCEIRVFGSRVTGQWRKHSDLDLALVGKDKIDWRRIEALKDNFSESDLPFMVDVLDWHAISEPFRQIIDTQYEVINTDQR